MGRIMNKEYLKIRDKSMNKKYIKVDDEINM
jgi:hypothetical protein